MELLEFTRVLVDDVGRPRNDGTAGSGLYAVPVGLNRPPDSTERELLVAHWNRPPRFTTMHRPGILRVEVDRVVLDGTTIEEVERYHAATLTLVAEKVNEDALTLRRQQAELAESEAKQAQAHAQHVSDVADDISF